MENHVPENFEKYVRQVLKFAGQSDEAIEAATVGFRPMIRRQLEEIQNQATITEGKLSEIQSPIFMAQAGQDEMIDPYGVFETAKKMAEKRVTLQWYPNSKHVITVGDSRRILEKDVLDFLENLPWNEESI